MKKKAKSKKVANTRSREQLRKSNPYYRSHTPRYWNFAMTKSKKKMA